ncbi:MAG TPA: hypoxanthine phosphoribosyltransferase [Nitrospiraceae bacterium]|nr:hypoxanthine phosphoribosyltransferase [Nitrospiraceae bacterium]
MSEIEAILFDEKTIERRARELAAAISKDYAGRELVLVCILKGAVVFTADLMRYLSIPTTIEFIQASSYGDAAVSSRMITMKKDIDVDVKGKDVLLVDCIIDTGDTMAYVMERFREKGPASLEAVVLLDKKPRRRVDVAVKYIGYEIPDRFVVGYGLDYAQQYRCLPYIAALTPGAE